LPAESIVTSLQREDVVTWLHFNLSDARARRWLLQAQFLPQPLRGVLERYDENRCIELTEDELLLVIGDVTFEDDSDPSEVATLWCFAAPHRSITARFHPLKSPDELRARLQRRCCELGHRSIESVVEFTLGTVAALGEQNDSVAGWR
jgi:zinc transporter